MGERNANYANLCGGRTGNGIEERKKAYPSIFIKSTLSPHGGKGSLWKLVAGGLACEAPDVRAFSSGASRITSHPRQLIIPKLTHNPIRTNLGGFGEWDYNRTHDPHYSGCDYYFGHVIHAPG